VKKLQSEEAKIVEYKKYLGKNREFLVGLSAAEAKFLKVQGNLQIILKQMEDTQKQIQKLHIDIDKEGCTECK
jgi:hypothetical protein